MIANQEQLDYLAAQATAAGFQVTFATRTETEGTLAGRTLREITISAYDEPTQQEARVSKFFADQEASNRARAELGID